MEIHADTKLISHDSAFSLASILLTSDFIQRVRALTNLALVLSQVFPFHGYECTDCINFLWGYRPFSVAIYKTILWLYSVHGASFLSR